MRLPEAAIPEMHRSQNGPPEYSTLNSTPNADLGPPLAGLGYKDIPDLNVLFDPPTSNKSKTWRWLFFGVGVAMAAYGLVGTFVPVLPGFPILLVGLAIMATSNEAARGMANRLERHLPMRTRLMLRKYKPTMPPRGATREQMRYWRKKTAISAFLFVASVGFFTGVGLATAWLVQFLFLA